MMNKNNKIINTEIDTDKVSKISKLGLALSFLGVVLLGVVIVGVSIYGLDKSENRTIQLEQFTVDATNAHFTLEASDTTFKKNEENTLVVKLDTGGIEVNNVDFILKYDPNLIEINSNNTTVYQNLFDSYKKNPNTTAGTLEINGGALSDNFFKTVKTSGLQLFAKIPFKLKTTSNTRADILCTAGSTIDSNIITLDGDIINCARNVNLEFANVSDESQSTPTPSPSPSGTSVATTIATAVATSSNGNSGTGGGSTGSSSQPWCKKIAPSRPTNLKATTTGKSQQVYLTWNRVTEEVTHYTVSYGKKWMEFQYGQPNIGNVNTFYVNGLQNGVGYYFVVTAVNDCASSGYSDGAAAYAGWIPGSGPVYSPKPKASLTPVPKDKGYDPDPMPYDTTDVTVSPLPSPTAISTATPIVDDYSSPEDDYIYDTSKVFTPEPTFEAYDPGEDEKKPSSKMLPIIGLVVLGALGLLFIFLTKFAKREESL